MRRKITYDMVKQEFDERGYELMATEYVKNSEKLKYICPKHRERDVLEITFANFTKGRGCPYCAHRIKKTQDDYISELAAKKPTIEVLGRYKNLKTKILHRCKVCGYEWDVLPDNMLNTNNGCPKCGKRAPLTQEEFEQPFKEAALYMAHIYGLKPLRLVLPVFITHRLCLSCRKLTLPQSCPFPRGTEDIQNPPAPCSRAYRGRCRPPGSPRFRRIPNRRRYKCIS